MTAPRAELKSIIARIWQIEAHADAASPGHWGFPDGHSAWWFVLGDPLLRGRHRIGRGAYAFGVSRRALLSKPTGRLLVLGVVFKPGCAAAALKVPARALDERGRPLEELWGLRAGSLVDRLSAASDFAERRAILEGEILARLRPIDPEVSTAVKRLATSPGTRVRSLAVDRAAIRRLERKFRSGLGMPPKRLARMFRLQKVLRLWADGKHDSWAKLAAAAGYSDQAHFIRDFTDFVGEPPGAFVERERSVSHSFKRGSRLPETIDER